MDGSRRGLIGLGHDLQVVSDLKVDSALREPGIFFTSRELRHFDSAAVPMESLAGGFAAKEALFKALPASVIWFWTDAELVHDSRGAPQFRTHGSLASHVARYRLRLSVSISHSGGFVSSVVIITGGTSPVTRFFDATNRVVRRVLRRIAPHAAGTPQ